MDPILNSRRNSNKFLKLNTLNNIKIPSRAIIRSKTFNLVNFLGSGAVTPFHSSQSSSLSILKSQCIGTLKQKISNRKKEDIESALPYLTSLENFFDFMSNFENLDSFKYLLFQFTRILQYKKFKKKTIIKRSGENKDFFFLVLSGKVERLNLTFEKKSITLESYLIFLLKMKLLGENFLLSKIRNLNKKILDIDPDRINDFCEKNRNNKKSNYNNNYDYNKLLYQAKNDIINLGFKNILDNEENENEIFNENYDFDSKKNYYYNYNYYKNKSNDLIKIVINSNNKDEIENMYNDIFNIEIPSIQSYLDMTFISNDIKNEKNFSSSSSDSKSNSPSKSGNSNANSAKIYLWVPKYVKASSVNKGDFFGYINKETYEECSTYISSDDSEVEVAFFNKKFNQDSPALVNINLKMKKIFEDIKQNFFIFKNISSQTFSDNYSHLFCYQKFKKGEKIFVKGSLYEGIYLINSGEIKISTNPGTSHLNKLILELTLIPQGFHELALDDELKKMVNQECGNISNSSGGINENSLNASKFEDSGYDKNIPPSEGREKILGGGELNIITLGKGEVLGLNEMYDYKSYVNFFTAEVVSKEACLYFISKNDFGLMMCKEKSLSDFVINKVEMRIKYFIGIIKNYKNKLNYQLKNNKSLSVNSNINNNYCNYNKNENNIYGNKNIHRADNNIFTYNQKDYKDFPPIQNSNNNFPTSFKNFESFNFTEKNQKLKNIKVQVGNLNNSIYRLTNMKMNPYLNFNRNDSNNNYNYNYTKDNFKSSFNLNEYLYNKEKERNKSTKINFNSYNNTVTNNSDIYTNNINNYNKNIITNKNNTTTDNNNLFVTINTSRNSRDNSFGNNADYSESKNALISEKNMGYRNKFYSNSNLSSISNNSKNNNSRNKTNSDFPQVLPGIFRNRMTKKMKVTRFSKEKLPNLMIQQNYFGKRNDLAKNYSYASGSFSLGNQNYLIK